MELIDDVGVLEMAGLSHEREEDVDEAWRRRGGKDDDKVARTVETTR